MRGFGVAAIACACSLLVACGGTAGRASIPSSVAARLANESEAVATSLKGGDSCGALAKAQRLRRDVARAITAGSIPRTLAGDARNAAARLTAQITCTPPPPAPPTPQPQPAPKCNDHGQGKHKGEHGKECD